MTDEQVNDLMLQLRRLHPKMFGGDSMTFEDPEYEALEREATEGGKGILYDEVAVVSHAVIEVPASAPAGDQWEDVLFD